MAYEEKNGDISVFKNDKKEKDTHPDYRITGTGLDGKKIKGALWLKKDRNGKTYMSGKIEEDTYVKPDSGDAFSERRDEGFSGRAGNVSRDASDDPFGDPIPFVWY